MISRLALRSRMQLRFESEVARRWDFEIAHNWPPGCGCLLWVALSLSCRLRWWSILFHDTREPIAHAYTNTDTDTHTHAHTDAIGSFRDAFMVAEFFG